MITGNPALLKLARLKLRGSLRRQLRKIRSPSGVFFALVGGVISVGWIASLLVGRGMFNEAPPEPDVVRRWTQFGIAVFTFMSILSAISIRGVYFPKQEIERLFSAPVTRKELVRFRMLVDGGRTIFGAIVIGLLTVHRMPNPLYGFLGTATAVLTLGVVRQAFSLVLGSAHSKLGSLLEGKSLIFIRIVLGILIWLLIMSTVMGAKFAEKLFGSVDVFGEGARIIEHPIAQALLLPFKPWASMIAATNAQEFLIWGALCTALGFLFFEITARMPIDYREHSLETSDKIANRLTQVRRGGLFSGGRASTRTTSWRFPRLFGRSATGAVAWIKLVSIVRKARGTLLTGVLIVTLVTFFVTYLIGNSKAERAELESVGGSGMIALLGIVYLSGALRFDFRADLDRMVQIKAWPVSTRRIFVATLLPEVLLISALIGTAIFVRMLAMQEFYPIALVILLVLPLFTYAWLAVDNAVYLFAPVRFVPGQEGSLHHTGRAIVLIFLRMILMFLAMACVGLAAVVVFSVGPEEFGLTERQAGWITAGIGLFVLVFLCGFLTWVGGRMLRRFDVARDSG